MPDSGSLDIMNIPVDEHKKRGGSQFSIDIIQSLPIAIYTCNAEGYITAYNKAAATLWGREPEVSKERWSGAWKMYTLSGEPLELSECPIAKVAKEKSIRDGEEMVVERPDGTIKIVRSHPTPMFDGYGGLVGIINTLNDITEQKNNEENKARLAA